MTITIILVNGVWKPWSEWDSCNVTCGGGEKARRRECNGPFFDGDPCEGPTEERLTCNTFNCPSKETLKYILFRSPHKIITALQKRLTFVERITSRKYVAFSLKSALSNNGFLHFKTCCFWNIQKKSIAAFGTVLHCVAVACLSVDGVWEAWATWTSCSRPCGTGEQVRSRNCAGPFYNGSDCLGDWNQTKTCNTHSCAGNDFQCGFDILFGDSQWVRI